MVYCFFYTIIMFNIQLLFNCIFFIIYSLFFSCILNFERALYYISHQPEMNIVAFPVARRRGLQYVII